MTEAKTILFQNIINLFLTANEYFLTQGTLYKLDKVKWTKKKMCEQHWIFQHVYKLLFKLIILSSICDETVKDWL